MFGNPYPLSREFLVAAYNSAYFSIYIKCTCETGLQMPIDQYAKRKIPTFTYLWDPYVKNTAVISDIHMADIYILEIIDITLGNGQ